MSRQQLEKRTILLREEKQRDTAMKLIANLPLDDDNPLQIVISEKTKVRKLDQNAAYWAGQLHDIAMQAWFEGRQYSAEVLHEYFKREFLPEELDAELCKEGYTKWAYPPSGDRVLVGSTTQLTIKGFAQYMTQVEAFGAAAGVQFSALPNDRRFE